MHTYAYTHMAEMRFVMPIDSSNLPEADPSSLYVRESAHRTANVLQGAMAALRICRRGSEVDLDAALDRLEGAADLHAILAIGGNQSVDLGKHLDDACVATGRAAGASDDVELMLDAPSMPVRAEDARRVAMIVTELVGNSIRHAFEDGKGCIRVAVRNNARRTCVLVEDDGRCEGWSRPGGQGYDIVDELARSLGGEVRRDRTAGNSSRVEVVLPTIATVNRPVA